MKIVAWMPPLSLNLTRRIKCDIQIFVLYRKNPNKNKI